MASGTCIRCRRESETIRVLECPICNQLSSVLSFIYSRWDSSEIPDLVKGLREGTNESVAASARERGASLLVRLCELIRRLAFVANCHTDHFKTRVADELVKHAAFTNQVREWETKKGGTPGEYNRQAAAAITEAFRTHFGISTVEITQAIQPPSLSPEPAGMTML